MNKLFASAVAAFMLLGFVGQAQALPEPDMSPKWTYELVDVMKVAGRQGVCSDGKYMYVSCSKALYKYDMKTGKLVKKNMKPFEKGFAKPVNHFGDIDIYNGEIYTCVENFMDGVGSNIQVAELNALAAMLSIIKWKRIVEFYGDTTCAGDLNIAYSVADNAIIHSTHLTNGA